MEFVLKLTKKQQKRRWFSFFVNSTYGTKPNERAKTPEFYEKAKQLANDIVEGSE